MITPTLKQLRYLVALHDQMHFGRAAESCHVTQSTLSSGIAELETLLDADLVERTRRALWFTPLGENVVKKARKILREVDELVDLTQAASEPLSGTIRIGIIPTIAPFLLPQAMPQLRIAYPKLKLQFREQLSDILCHELLSGELDIILYALPYRCGDVHEEPLFQDPFLAAYPPDHAPLPDMVSTEDLDGETLLLLEEGHCLRDHALAACSLPGVDPSRSILGTSLHTLVQMVESGMGMTLIPQMALDGGILNGTHVRTVPLSGDAPARTIGLVWRKNSARQSDYMLLADMLKSWHKKRKQ
ncbi:LysR family transcriptional regulator [Iodidimonas gelatinilytica]|uniref:LysR family transcriptional regulator n=1 Tax=Iodidimonas gelatinilytica TaxID=1236966 RepID=A0A5A7MPS7_9PROT|nr:hydrogen peroxide-inducible genes activator [Iodidimonas gelatinilytica]GEQ97971.1 LysR family transcriptional regulator [Iodidimonas gelatinilytica]